MAKLKTAMQIANEGAQLLNTGEELRKYLSSKPRINKLLRNTFEGEKAREAAFKSQNIYKGIKDKEAFARFDLLLELDIEADIDNENILAAKFESNDKKINELVESKFAERVEAIKEAYKVGLELAKNEYFSKFSENEKAEIEAEKLAVSLS